MFDIDCKPNTIGEMPRNVPKNLRRLPRTITPNQLLWLEARRLGASLGEHRMSAIVDDALRLYVEKNRDQLPAKAPKSKGQ